MALSRRSTNRFHASIWPGFVDAMTGLLLVLMFVLTIFMVIQFVLRETITGQESQLSELSAEVAALAQALGLERDRSANLAGQVGTLTTSLSRISDQSDEQTALIAALTQERDDRAEALAEAQNRITGFEAQVAGLLAQRSELRANVAGLEAEQARILSEQEALNLALAQARSEIDAGVESARLAAARRAALEALVAELQGSTEASSARISDLEAAQLVDAAAAEALRARLADADAELTAMTLALEEQRKRAEDTLTLLAAARSARDTLDMNLAAALLAQQQAQNDLTRALNEGSDLDARLLAALGLQEQTAAELQAARDALAAAEADKADLNTRLAAALTANDVAAGDLAAVQEALDQAVRDSQLTEAEIQERLAAALLAKQALEAELAAANQAGTAAAANVVTLEDRLAAALLAQQSLQAQVDSLSESRSETEQGRADLEARLAEALAAMKAAQETTATQMSEAERQAALLAAANQQLSDEQALSAESQRQVALLNEQMAQLRTQVATLQSLLDVSAEADARSQVQIEALGSQLNTALARVAAEERRRRELETAERERLEAERARLEAETQNLERYRSEFFGRMRDVLAGQEGVRIEGDRFVFSSEVLFQPGQADLSEEGQQEIAKVAALLRRIADDIPPGIDWVIRVDGHTDNLPLSGFGRYRNNWELSQARALSVVLYMAETQGIPPNRLAANGFGEYQPIDPADTPEARAQNRRIELKLTER
jgi:chemotaxis protein MotB